MLQVVVEWQCSGLIDRNKALHFSNGILADDSAGNARRQCGGASLPGRGRGVFLLRCLLSVLLHVLGFAFGGAFDILCLALLSTHG